MININIEISIIYINQNQIVQKIHLHQNLQTEYQLFKSFDKLSVHHIAYIYIIQFSINVISLSQMGNCNSLHTTKLKQHHFYQQIPSGTQQLKKQIHPMLVFEVRISDVEIKKCLQDQVFVKIAIQNLFQCEFPLKKVNENQKVEWKINYSFCFKMTEYCLRQKFAVIEIHDRSKQIIASQFINMFAIWTGPYHLDFKFQMSNAKSCRLELNFKISQGCHLKIENLTTQIQPKDKVFPSELITFCAEAIIGQQMDPSNYAYLVRIENSEDINNKHLKQGTSPLQSIETYNVTGDKIIWRAELAKVQPLPVFDRNIACYEIHSSSLHFTFWKVRCGLQDNTETFYQIYCECFISINKLLICNYKIWKDPISAIQYAERIIDIEDKAWLHGKEMGTVRFKLKFTLQEHEKQMQACVMTQNGISTTSPVFDTDKIKQCAQIETLKKLSQQIEQGFAKLDQSQEEKKNLIQISDNMLCIRNLLEHEINLLKRSNRSTMLFYDYKDAMELATAQRVFIDLAFRAVTYLHQGQSDMQKNCWKILKVILKRGQLSLQNMSFDKSQKKKIKNGQINDKLAYKIKVGLKYQELLNYLIKETLITLYMKGEQAKSEFAEFFCAYAFFRVPLFRDHILSVIKRENDPQIADWQKNEFYRQEFNYQVNSSNFYNHYFNWQDNFWKYLSSYQKYKSNQSQLDTTLLKSNWKQHLGKRKGSFFTFLSNFGKQIKNISGKCRHIKWQCIPGYNKIMHAFLVDIASMKICDYNERVRKCCTSLLENFKLINLFVMIVLKKCNINDSKGVSMALQLIDEFFKQVRMKTHSFPTTFDYIFFLHGMRMVLDGDSQFNTSLVLLLLYTNFNYFGQEFSLELLLYLLSRPYFRFFFHWSFCLRYVFHTIMYALVTKVQKDVNTTIKKNSITYKNQQRWYTRNDLNVNLPIDRMDNQQSKTKNFAQIDEDGDSQNDYLKSLKMAIVQRYDSIQNIVKKEIQPKTSNINKDCFHEKDLFRKMRFKFREKNPMKEMGLQYVHNKRVNSLTEQLKQLHPLKLRSIRPLDNFAESIVPKRCLYFSQEDIILMPITLDAFSYVGIALIEYAAVKSQFDNNIRIDPNYWPNIKANKVLDKQQFKPLSLDDR